MAIAWPFAIGGREKRGCEDRGVMSDGNFMRTTVVLRPRLAGRERSRSRRGGRGAFTLVELLVVIGIIGLLTSLLLPAMAGVRQQAQATRCSVNLRSLATGWSMYANAYKGVSAPGRLPTTGAIGGV